MLKIDFPSLDGYPDYKYVTNFHKYFIVKQLDAIWQSECY